MDEPKPTPEQSEFVLATLRNASALITDAAILWQADRYARAYALATFAVEEAGKAWRADRQLASEPLTEFARLNHRAKLTAARQMFHMYVMTRVQGGEVDTERLFSEEHELAAQDEFNARMAGLYVDFVDGRVVGGPDTMSMERSYHATYQGRQVVQVALELLWGKNGGSPDAKPRPQDSKGFRPPRPWW